jgi:hypothetical protein
MTSFLLTQPRPQAVGLREWLARHPDDRRLIIRQLDDLLRCLHEAGCYLGGPAGEVTRYFQVQADAAGPRVVLGSAAALRRRCPRRRLADGARLVAALGPAPGRAACPTESVA